MQRGQVVMEMLEKQLQLLSERSQKCVDDHELVELTEAMIKVVSALRPSA